MATGQNLGLASLLHQIKLRFCTWVFTVIIVDCNMNDFGSPKFFDEHFRPWNIFSWKLFQMNSFGHQKWTVSATCQIFKKWAISAVKIFSWSVSAAFFVKMNDFGRCIFFEKKFFKWTLSATIEDIGFLSCRPKPDFTWLLLFELLSATKRDFHIQILPGTFHFQDGFFSAILDFCFRFITFL